MSLRISTGILHITPLRDDMTAMMSSTATLVVAATTAATTDLNSAEAASNGADEERELMLLEAAEHVKMARAQRALCKAKVADAVADATEGKDHAERRYTFVIDYGQNMELPIYNKEQPGIM